MFETLTYEELELVNGGGAKEVVCTIVGVCGGVVGAAGGFLGGFAVTTIEFTPIVGVVAGVGTGVVGAGLGYAGAKSAAEDAWDYIAAAL